MAVMLAEEWGELPLHQEDARDRLPQVMAYMGFRRLDEGIWKRRRDRCGSGWWSLPDACPTLLQWHFTEVDAPERRPDTKPRTRYALTYTVAMPGQILAHTDAKALELEIDRILHLLIGGFDRDTRRERARLVRWTLMANLLLSLMPAVVMLAALWMTRPVIETMHPLWAFLWIVGFGGSLWLLGLALTARSVVRLLNARIPTRLSYRSVKPEEPSLSQGMPVLEPSAPIKKGSA